MSTTDVLDHDLTTVAALVAERQVAPAELVDAALRRIAEIRGANAFITVFADEAREVARASGTLLRAGHRLGPLHGVPVVLKDNIGVRDRITTAGSAILRDHRPEDDAAVVRRLRAAGAIVVAKTNMNEFAWGFDGANPHYGDMTNPWDAARIPGGSSGGSAVALAARACFGALGTDTGGSARVPAALTATTGLRPTYGLVSNAGVVPVAESMDTVAPMARTAEDCAALLAAITGSADRDDMPLYASPADRDGVSDIDGIRVGLIDDRSLPGVQDPVRRAFRAVLDDFTGAGARVIATPVPDLAADPASHLLVATAEPSAYHRRWLRERPHDYSATVRASFEAGESVPATAYLGFQRERARLRAQALAALARADVLATPTMPFTASPIGATTVELDGEPADLLPQSMRFTALPSLTGLPAVSVPCGFDDAGLPIGLQLIGRPHADAHLLRVAAAFQRGTSFHRRTPPLIAGR